MKKFLTQIVTSLLIFGTVFVSNVSASGNEGNFNLESIEDHENIVELTTEYADAYISGEDQITYIIDSKKIRYKDENGSWQDVNNEIIQEKDASGKYNYRNRANDFSTFFGDNEKGQPMARIEKGKYSIEFVLLSDKSTLSKEQSVEDNEYIKQINDQNNSLIYDHVFADSVLAYTVFGDELKEDIIFYSKPNLSSIEYIIECENLEFAGINKECRGYDEDTGEEICYSKRVGVFFDPSTCEEIFELKDFFMVDSNNNTSSDLEWKYEKTGNKYAFTLLLDKAFLDNENIKYPIIVDPSVTASGSSYTYDTYASRLYPNTNYYLNNYLRTGKDDTYGRRRTFIRWVLPSIAQQYPVIDADIQLKLSSYSGSINLWTGRLTTSWSPSSLTWWNSPDYDANSEVHDFYISSGWCFIDIIDIGKRWYSGQYNNYGVKIFDKYDETTSSWQTFYSSDFSTTSYNPKLVITYYTGNTLWSVTSNGYSSSTITFKNCCLTYSDEVYSSTAAWRGAGWNLFIDSGSSNLIYESPGTLLGPYAIYYFPSNFPDGHVEIELRTTKISEDKEWDGFAQSVLVHEMGHALGLGDRTSDSLCIMGYLRDRNTLIYPTASDIAGVDYLW